MKQELTVKNQPLNVVNEQVSLFSPEIKMKT